MKKAQTVMSFDALLQHLHDTPWRDEIFMVALEGRSGSGRTMLARRLAQSLGAQLLHTEDFYRVIPDEQQAAFTPEQRYEQHFGWHRLRAELTTLRNGNGSSFLSYARTDDLPRQISLSPEGWLIVEGRFTLRPELRHLYDLTVYVDRPEDLRLTRSNERSRDNSALTQRWEAAEAWYHQHFAPREAADIVIPGAGL